MTDIQGEAVVTEEPSAARGHHYVTFKERRILIKSINTAQNMVLGDLLRNLDGPRTTEEYLQILGKLMRLVNSLLAVEADRKWLEDSILDGALDIEDFAVIFLPVAEESEAPRKTRKPRRGQ